MGTRIRPLLKARTGSPTIPQIWIAGTHVGGATDLFDAMRDGRMQRCSSRRASRSTATPKSTRRSSCRSGCILARRREGATTMSFIDTIPPAAAEGETAAMYRRQQAAWGYVPNYAKAFSHRPEVMARWGALLAEIRRPMDRRRFELATFAAAHELRNSACALAHGRALGEFFAEAEVVAIAEGRLDGVLDDAEQAIVRFARQVARDASRMRRRTSPRWRPGGSTRARSSTSPRPRPAAPSSPRCSTRSA